MTTRNGILNNLDIKPTDWVLEIGGGPIPFVRSDILTDKFLEEDTERAGSLVVDRPLVICDAHYLPFVDNSFDYVFCSQILEHLDDPRAFFSEIQRVGKKGYIETPNEIRERLFGWPFHKWIVDQDENGLVLRENDVEQAFGLFFHRLQGENYEFSKFCSAAHDLLNICYEWHGKSNFRFAKEGEYKLPNQKVSINLDDVSDIVLSKQYKGTLANHLRLFRMLKKRLPKKLKEILKRVFYSPPYGYRHSEDEITAYLKEVLACPLCKERVMFGDRRPIACPKCQRRFKVENSILFMLIE